MATYWPAPGLKGRTFKLCVLTRWDFNFCVRSSPLRETDRNTSRWTHRVSSIIASSLDHTILVWYYYLAQHIVLCSDVVLILLATLTLQTYTIDLCKHLLNVNLCKTFVTTDRLTWWTNEENSHLKGYWTWADWAPVRLDLFAYKQFKLMQLLI